MTSLNAPVNWISRVLGVSDESNFTPELYIKPPLEGSTNLLPSRWTRKAAPIFIVLNLSCTFDLSLEGEGRSLLYRRTSELYKGVDSNVLDSRGHLSGRVTKMSNLTWDI
jgi:hypothetical protein